MIVNGSMQYFGRIEAFLKNARNSNLAALYHDSANDIKGKILVNRDKFDTFDNVFLFLAEEIQKGSGALKGKRRMISTLLHYMYCSCDIGSKQIYPVVDIDNANA